MKRFSSDWYWYYVINYTLVILIIFPIYWTFISSVKTPAELITSDPTYFPETWTWKYYFQIWNYDLSSTWQLSSDDYMSLESKSLKENIINFFIPDETKSIGRAFWNSCFVSFGTILLTTIVCTFAGYALAILRGPFKNIIFLLIITPILFPGVSLLIPLYKILKDIGLLNNLYGLIFLHSTFMLPLGVFMMRNAFISIPSSLREVAILEGTSELQIILRVLLPLCIPGLLTVMVFAMYVSWNDYIFAYVFVTTGEREVLNVALAKIALGGNEFDMKWGSITAGSVISFIPIIIFYTFLQQYFVRGVTGSAVKE